MTSRLQLPAVVALCALALVLSATLADGGGRADLRARAADCGRSFLPNPEAGPRLLAAGLPGAGQGGAPALLSPADGRYRAVGRAGAGDGRTERLRGGRWAIAVTSVERDTTCRRLVMTASPAAIRVGLVGGEIEHTVAPDAVVRPANEEASDDGNTVYLEEREPGMTRVVVRLYQNGEPVENEEVVVRPLGTMSPGPYGVTWGHEHLAGTGSATIGIGAPGGGGAVKVRTDFEGKATFEVFGGYRGGPEGLEAEWANEDGATVTTRDPTILVVQHEAGFTNLGRALGLPASDSLAIDTTSVTESGSVVTDTAFAFPVPRVRPIGFSEAHYFPHWVRPGVAAHVIGSLEAVVRHDEAVREALASDPDRRFVVALGPGSLEYGGKFDPGGMFGSGAASAGAEVGAGTGPLLTHDRGLSFDVAPCYMELPRWQESLGEGDARRRARDAARCTGSSLAVDEGRLVASVTSRLDAVVTTHDSGPLRGFYHVQIPDARADTTSTDNRGLFDPGS